MTKTDYNKLLNENITKSYKKGDENVYRVNHEAKEIAKKIGITDKVECFVERDAFITLKDHKDNFQNNPKCRLINPSKSQMGKVSKKYLEKIVSSVASSLELNQWQSTDPVLKWFKQLPHKKRSKFMKFDIADFYPSITEALLDSAISFAQQHTEINDDEIKAIKHARKCFLVSNKQIWTKKNNNNLFDVTMGSYDGAEVCELVGLLLLNELSHILGKDNVGLYRDDGLAVLDRASGPQMDRMRKDIIALFQRHGLSITIDVNLNIVDFLDVTFNLGKNRYYPYRKPNDTPLYINAKSNHPKSILKQVPTMINDRLSNLSCNEREFNKVKDLYQSALDSSGHQIELKYTPNKGKKRQRKRKIIWFNPPFSENVKTNIGKAFLNLIRIHFQRHHRYFRIFNTNTLKLSYSCMPNMSQIIKQHNTKILQPLTNQQHLCNCQRPDSCPLRGDCNSADVVYQATVLSNSSGNPDDPVPSNTPNENVYIGSATGPFKLRYRNHVKTFNSVQYEKDTELSKFIWKLKTKEIQFTTSWTIVARASPYRCGSKQCNLCLSEKVAIARSNHKGLLNKRTELLGKCRHKNKFLLSCIK